MHEQLPLEAKDFVHTCYPLNKISNEMLAYMFSVCDAVGLSTEAKCRAYAMLHRYLAAKN